MIKFGMTIAEMIAQLTRGFIKATGRKPDGLEKIKIQQEAVNKFKEQQKVVDMEGKVLDPDKVIMGGTQEGNALKSGIMKATNIKPRAVPESFQKQIEQKYGITLQGDETVDEIKKIIENLPTDKKADGGRIGFKGGADMGTVDAKDSKGNVTRAATAKSVSVSPSGSVTTSRTKDPDPVDDRSTFKQTINQKNIVNRSKEPKTSFFNKAYNTGQELNYLRNLIMGNFPGLGKQLLLDLGKRKFLDSRTMLDPQGIINGLPTNEFAELTDLQKKMLEGPQKNLKDIMGISNEEILKNIEKFNNPDSPATIKDIEEFYQQAKEGGRIGFKKGSMDRRTFMKIMGGLATLPVVGRFFRGAEKAAPIAEKAVETVQAAPNYFFELLAKIKAFGDDITGSAERINAKKYKNYTLEEDMVTGDVTIKKTKEGVVGDAEGVMQEEFMILKKGNMDETTKGRVPPDEYEELTIRPDGEGKMKDVEDGLDSVEEIIEEVSKKSVPIKKAAGGLAYMLGE
jgi:hypothetical protein